MRITIVAIAKKCNTTHAGHRRQHRKPAEGIAGAYKYIEAHVFKLTSIVKCKTSMHALDGSGNEAHAAVAVFEVMRLG